MNQPSRPVLIAILIAMGAMGPMALHIFLPSMPGLQRALDTDYGTVQLTLTLYFGTLAFAQLVYGPLSDRLGRRPVVIAGMLLFLAGSIACMLAPTIALLIGGRVLQAIGACAGIALGRAIIRDLYDREEAASMMAYVTMAMVAAPLVAPTIGGYLDIWFGWRSVFVFVFVVGAVVTTAAVLRLEETHPVRTQETGFPGLLYSFGYLLRRRAFCAYALQTAFTTGVFFGFLGGAPYVFVELLGRPPNEYGPYFMLMAGAYMLGNLIAGRISPRVGSDRMIAIGTFGAVVCTGVLAVLAATGPLTTETLFAPMTVLSVFHGFSMPNGNAGTVSVDPSRAGAAAGLSGFLQMGIGAIASHVVGATLGDSAAPLVAVALTLSVCAFAVHGLGVGWGRAGKAAMGH